MVEVQDQVIKLVERKVQNKSCQITNPQKSNQQSLRINQNKYGKIITKKYYNNLV